MTLLRRLFAASAALATLSLSGAAPSALVRPHVQVPPAGPREGRAAHAMVAAANPHAVEAGLEVLRRGGSAVDAAVAVQAVLGLVEPQSSGLGGGAFMVFYDAKTRQVTAYDGRETAPAGATREMFLGPEGQPLPFGEAVVSGRATGVPGAVAMLALAQKQYGRLKWNSLFGYAERLGDEGFTVSPRLASMIAGRFPQNEQPDMRAYFARPGGGLMVAGDTLRNPAYAQTLRRIADKGADGLLAGPVAKAIVAKTHEAPLPGSMTLADLKAYKPRAYEAVCGPYRVYVVCAPAPPSSGAALLQALAMLERTDIARRGPNDPQAWFLLIQALRVMYADRDKYFGDPAFVAVPLGGLLDPAYVDQRARLIGDTAGPPPPAGTPKGAPRMGADATVEPGGTTHFVIVDAQGNVVSMTTTVESIFGTGRMAGGFFLNNQLTDFSFSPWEPGGAPAANAPAPGKRPRSSMSPVVVLDRQGRFVAALGSPGGNTIPAYNLKTLVGVLDWGLTMQQAIDLPNVIGRGAVFGVEKSRMSPAVVQGLAARGVQARDLSGEASGIHGVIVRGGVLEGGADPRREGVARGF
ncbi:MAG: gamma-glutamyltransferase [Caulobacteraceae bacterium]